MTNNNLFDIGPKTHEIHNGAITNTQPTSPMLST